MKNLSVHQLLIKAKSHVKKGQLLDAQKIYQDVLQIFPANKRAQQGLSSLNKQKQINLPKDPSQETIKQLLKLYNQDKLEILAEQAQILIKQYPYSNTLWKILGVSSAQIGKLNQAILALKKSVYLNPLDSEAFYNLGNAFHGQGELDEAIKAYKDALSIKSDYAEASNSMGIAFKDQGQLDLALKEYKKALIINPNYVDAYINMGSALKDQGKLDEAIDAYRKVILLKPDYAEAYYNMGNALKSQGKQDDALKAYKMAINFKPNYSEALNNIGNALKDKGNFDDAIVAYNKALINNPDGAEIYSNIGNALKDSDKLKDAVDAYNRALSLDPDNCQFNYNKANALLDQGKLDESIKLYNKALAIEPDYNEARFNIGLAKLKKLDFKTGFELYHQRFNTNEFKGDPLLVSKPVWTGQRNKKIFLWAEQGLGDEIMFASLIPDLYAVSSKLILQCDERLIPLFKRSFNDDIIYHSNRNLVSEVDYDFHIPIGSLPSILRPNIESFKNTSKGYLFCQKNNHKQLIKLNAKNDNKTIIGISWSTTSVNPSSKRRSIPLEMMACLLGSPETMLVSLQYGNVSKEISDLKEKTGIDVVQVSQVDNKKDIDGLAALIMECDCVVSVDNSTVHLAGALGKSTKVLLPFACDWRWGTELINSYWYNSLCLYRQKEPNVWNDAFNKLIKDIMII